MVTAAETIFALSSGGLPSGVAVLRISGGGVRFGLETLVDSVPEPRNASLRLIKGCDGAPLDRGLVLFFPQPASFTGEDVAELHLHGGRAVVAAVLERLAGLEGFRPADPGEFTRRAFLNHRLDLTQAEGLADLVAAETDAQRRLALRQAGGALRDLYEGWRARLLRCRALVEAALDFSDEEDVPESVGSEIWRDLGALVGEIGVHLDDSGRGERIRSGVEIVILGPPNAGKSSLLNLLARREVAIVTPEAGTTRDLIEVHMDIEGFSATLVDTAGLREATGVVEAEGIRRAEARAANADLVLLLSDVGEDRVVQPDDSAPKIFRVGTKIDRIDSEVERSSLRRDFDFLISSVSGEGIDELLSRISRYFSEEFAGGEEPLITRARHRRALEECRESLISACSESSGLELRAEELRRATDSLGRITGRVDVEDLLDVIFGEFCIGK